MTLDGERDDSSCVIRNPTIMSLVNRANRANSSLPPTQSQYLPVQGKTCTLEPLDLLNAVGLSIKPV